MDCPFCDIVKLKYRLLENAKNYVVILSNPRMMPGHTLVIPKRHILKPSQMTAKERTDVFNAVLKWEDKITKVFSTGCNVRQNYMPFVKQSSLKVDHVHYHLLPCEYKDEHYFLVDVHSKKLFKPLSEKELKEIEEIYLK